ncbi:MAG: hypothetical protein LCH56_08245 [Proteobacteria bacterium]|nr:hypothetical protein [Pseudomonadota bacterium]
MLGEFFRYITTFAPERVRKFGYLKRLIALEFRAKRCESAWAEHQRNCKAIITKAADLCEQQKLAVVLGSGLLLEVPLKALSDRFEKVILVDIFHMPQVIAEARKHFNVKTLTGDITGVFKAMKERRAPGSNHPAPPPLIPHLKEADLIVSCNCLTWLAKPFTDHFEKERGFSDLDSDKVAYQIMERHAKAIAEEATGVGLIISDTDRFAMQGDHIVSRTDLLKALKLPPTATVGHNEEWDWLAAPHPEDHPTHDYIHTVVARVYQRNISEEDKAKMAADGELPPELQDGMPAEEAVDDIGDIGDIIPERI